MSMTLSGASPPAPTEIKSVGSSDPTKEYVAGGLFPWIGANGPHSLPWAIDDITQDFGADLYDRMLNDAQVDSAVEILKLATIVQGLTLNSAIRQDDEDVTQTDRDLAEEIRGFCHSVLEGLEQPFVADTLYSMLDAVAFGNKVAEVVYYPITSGEWDGKIGIKRIKVKPRTSLAFVVDAYMNVLGFAVKKPGKPLLVPFIGSYNVNSSNFELIQREKFFVLSFRPRDADPRGTSIIRPAYNAWWMKMQTYPEYLKFLATFAVPQLVGELSENAIEVVQVDENGEIVVDSAGNPVILSPTTSLLDTLVQLRNGTAAVVPSGTKVYPIFTSQPSSQPFRDAIQAFNQEITKAILCQTLATEEGQYQARAAAQTHQDVLDLVIYHCKITLAAAIRNDLLRPLVLLNYGDDAAKKFVPCPSLSETERHDFAQNATAIARLSSVGFIHESQLQALDALLSLPLRADPVWGNPPAAQKGPSGDQPGDNEDTNKTNNDRSQPSDSGGNPAN
jgi:hypothetical protein